MMSLQTIRDIQAEAAERAAEEGLTPFVTWPEDLDRIEQQHRFPFPFIGDYVPDGWTLEDEYFVDSSGFGGDGEAAMSAERFMDVLAEHVGAGWAIREAGQFQVMVGRYSKS
jgi:hypothetical protein